jgi:hypothetical protein
VQFFTGVKLVALPFFDGQPRMHAPLLEFMMCRKKRGLFGTKVDLVLFFDGILLDVTLGASNLSRSSQCARAMGALQQSGTSNFDACGLSSFFSV